MAGEVCRGPGRANPDTRQSPELAQLSADYWQVPRGEACSRRAVWSRTLEMGEEAGGMRWRWSRPQWWDGLVHGREGARREEWEGGGEGVLGGRRGAGGGGRRGGRARRLCTVVLKPHSLCSEPYLKCKSPGPSPAASDPRSRARGLGVCILRWAVRAHTLRRVAQTVSVTRVKREPRPGTEEAHERNASSFPWLVLST